MKYRDMGAANAKTKTEGRCRGCDREDPPTGLRPVHTIGPDQQDEPWHETSPTLWVNPHSVVPLCGWCSMDLGARRLNLMVKMTLEEQLDAVRGAGGILPAVDRIAGVRA